MHYIFTAKSDLLKCLTKDSTPLAGKSMALFSVSNLVENLNENEALEHKKYYTDSFAISFPGNESLLAAIIKSDKSIYTDDSLFQSIKEDYEKLPVASKPEVKAIRKVTCGEHKIYSCPAIDKEGKRDFITCLLTDIFNNDVSTEKNINLILHGSDIFSTHLRFEENLDIEKNMNLLKAMNPLLPTSLLDRIRKVYMFNHASNLDSFYLFFDQRKSSPNCIEELLVFIENPTVAKDFVEMKDNLNSYIASQDKQPFDKYDPKFFHDFKVKQVN